MLVSTNVLENGNLRLLVQQSEAQGFGFLTEVRSVDGWRSASRSLCRPVDSLSANHSEQDAARIFFSGKVHGMDWHSEIRPDRTGFRVESTLMVREETTLNPSMILWIGPLDNMEDRQAHTWRQTVLRGPTTNQAGLAGNDLPACYLYDQAAQLETICYFPPEMLGWMPGRLYELNASEVFAYRPTPRYGVGLIPATPESLITLPPGTYIFAWWFTQRSLAEVPTLWEAQRHLISAIAPLLDPAPSVTSDTPGWDQMAQNTLSDLQNDACWIDIEGRQSLRAYVRGSSALRRDEARGFELMTLLDVAWPLLLWREAHPDSAADTLYERLRRNMDVFYRPAEQFISNGFPRRETFMDTWYFAENALIKWPWVAYLTEDVTLREMFEVALKGATLLAHNTNYLFPLFADASDWQPRNSILNVSVGGLYAAGHLLAYQMDGQERHLVEAETALRTMHHLPPHMLTHEPQQLTFSAAAAQLLAKFRQLPSWAGITEDFLGLLLRMGYWGKDPNATFYDTRGMFQACASLSYPAYKENIESLIAWPELISAGIGPTRLLATFANLQRHHNYAFFDQWMPKALQRGPCPYIPYEDLATTEFPHTAELGKELYGAGEVFWSALLFDTVARVDDSNVLCLNLDLPCLELRHLDFSRPDRVLLYNPTQVERTIRLSTRQSEHRSLTLEPNLIQILTGP